MSTPNKFKAAVAEMANQGMVTSTALADIWDVSPETVRHYALTGIISKGEWHEGARSYFYDQGLSKPLITALGNPTLTGKKRTRKHLFHDVVIRDIGKVDLDPEWSVWPAPKTCKRSCGWMGG